MFPRLFIGTKTLLKCINGLKLLAQSKLSKLTKNVQLRMRKIISNFRVTVREMKWNGFRRAAEILWFLIHISYFSYFMLSKKAIQSKNSRSQRNLTKAITSLISLQPNLSHMLINSTLIPVLPTYTRNNICVKKLEQPGKPCANST